MNTSIYKKRENILPKIADFILDRSVFKELGEPVLLDENDVFFFVENEREVLGFAAINQKKDHCFLKYFYTKPKHRGNGCFSKLYNEVELYSESIKCGCLKAVSTNMALDAYRKRGFAVTKSWKKYHRISKTLKSTENE